MHSEMYQVDFLCIFLIKTLISEYDAFESSDLTTARILQNTSPKPTIFYRGINMERDETRILPDVFNCTESRRQKGKKDKTPSWAWDNWCLLQPKEGECYKHIERYYYNLQVDYCSNFSYSSCDGNQNNFETLTECEKYCSGSRHMNIIENTPQSNYCYLQPDPGLCLAMMEKYYYDINEQSCKKFTYGGCGGNRNKFDTKHSCRKACNFTEVRNES